MLKVQRENAVSPERTCCKFRENMTQVKNEHAESSERQCCKLGENML